MIVIAVHSGDRIGGGVLLVMASSKSNGRSVCDHVHSMGMTSALDHALGMQMATHGMWCACVHVWFSRGQIQLRSLIGMQSDHLTGLVHLVACLRLPVVYHRLNEIVLHNPAALCGWAANYGQHTQFCVTCHIST